ncbi:MAG TPA: signal peptidase I [Phenylobacterium sp.]|nr:signal peptidase I [Phenylobacterium sp.]
MTSVADDAPAAKSAGRELAETLKTVAGGLAIALVLRVFLFEPFTIPSASMEPGLLTGDYVVTSKWDYGWSRNSIPFSPPLFHGRVLFHSPQRGDVVVFKLPRDESVTYVKRIIGLPGDRVQVKGGLVFVNDRPIVRTPAGEAEDPDQPGLIVQQARETRADGHPYITFDQGPGHDGDDTGVYVVPADRYFMMGDNRDNSLDSRWPKELGVGFVPAENIVGKARFVMLSWREGASILKPWTWPKLRFDRAFRPVN